jgi:hypothetical protein
MIKKAMNVTSGLKVAKDEGDKKHKPHKHHYTSESVFRIQTCLNCTKPASECKGKCFEGV